MMTVQSFSPPLYDVGVAAKGVWRTEVRKEGNQGRNAGKAAIFTMFSVSFDSFRYQCVVGEPWVHGGEGG